jgi:hypothetical protein
MQPCAAVAARRHAAELTRCAAGVSCVRWRTGARLVLPAVWVVLDLEARPQLRQPRLLHRQGAPTRRAGQYAPRLPSTKRTTRTAVRGGAGLLYGTRRDSLARD